MVIVVLVNQCIADTFAQFFSIVFEKSTSVDENLPYEGDFVFPIVTENNVRLRIKKLEPKKANGEDNFSPYIYKSYRYYCKTPCTYFLNVNQNKYVSQSAQKFCNFTNIQSWQHSNQH